MYKSRPRYLGCLLWMCAYGLPVYFSFINMYRLLGVCFRGKTDGSSEFGCQKAQYMCGKRHATEFYLAARFTAGRGSRGGAHRAGCSRSPRPDSLYSIA